ncbi:MAG: Bax inhibitor-1/YccA family protein [Deltaproteobacteria bacterium]|nr:Bax inhibitor-1/YccA family protein [Deltaproteobacteria bacterium]
MAVSRYVSRTYGWMFLGLLITGMVSLGLASSEDAMRTIATSPGLMFGAIIAQFAVVIGLTAGFRRLSSAAAMGLFLLYSALTGVTMSVVFLVYTASSIANVFFITGGMFGGLALFGTITKKDLTGVGATVGMGLWGLILVGIVNMFVQSSALNMALSVVTVVIFAGLTAYDAQKIRMLALQSADGPSEESSKSAVYGALSLYLDFINMFWALLRLFGDRRE